MKIQKLIFEMLMMAMMLTACHGHKEHQDADDDDDDEPGVVHFPKELSEKLDFKVEKATEQAVGSVIHTVAQIMPSQGDEFIVSAKVDGVVKLASGASLNPGASIASGQNICTIDASASANDNLSVRQSQAQSEYLRAKAEYERLQGLRADKLALESEVNSAKAAYESAKAEYDALRKNYGSSGTQTVKAGRSGYLKSVMVQNGQHVSEGDAIAVITQSRTLRLHADVPAKSYPLLKDICGANIRPVDYGAEDARTWSLDELGGRLLSYGRQTEGNSQMLPVIFEINNVEDFLPGSFVDIMIMTKGDRQSVCVPSESILEEMGNHFVFVEVEPEHFVKRQVKIGTNDGKNVQIVSGVKKDERVVSRGAMLVRMQQQSGAADPHAGHSH